MRAPQAAAAFAYLIHDWFRILLTFAFALAAPAWAAARSEARALYLARQLALYREREAPRGPTTPSSRLAMLMLSRLFNWHDALVIVKPETLVRWHRDCFRRLWRWRSHRRGRPSLPAETIALIRQIARENVTKGEEKIAEVVRLQLGLRLSSRTIRKYTRDLLRVLREYARYYNEARPHSSLGPGFPDPPDGQPVELLPDRHRLPEGSRVVSRPVLGGLHHEYRLERAA